MPKKLESRVKKVKAKGVVKSKLKRKPTRRASNETKIEIKRLDDRVDGILEMQETIRACWQFPGDLVVLIDKHVAKGLSEFRGSMVEFERQLVVQKPEWSKVISGLTHAENRVEGLREAYNEKLADLGTRLDDLRRVYLALPKCDVLHSVVGQVLDKPTMPFLSKLYYRWMGMAA